GIIDVSSIEDNDADGRLFRSGLGLCCRAALGLLVRVCRHRWKGFEEQREQHQRDERRRAQAAPDLESGLKGFHGLNVAGFPAANKDYGVCKTSAGDEVNFGQKQTSCSPKLKSGPFSNTFPAWLKRLNRRYCRTSRKKNRPAPRASWRRVTWSSAGTTRSI